MESAPLCALTCGSVLSTSARCISSQMHSERTRDKRRRHISEDQPTTVTPEHRWKSEQVMTPCRRHVSRARDAPRRPGTLDPTRREKRQHQILPNNESRMCEGPLVDPTRASWLVCSQIPDDPIPTLRCRSVRSSNTPSKKIACTPASLPNSPSDEPWKRKMFRYGTCQAVKIALPHSLQSPRGKTQPGNHGRD